MAARIDILGVHVHAQCFNEAIDTLIGWAKEGRNRYVCTCPVYTIMACQEDERVKAVINRADMVTADGMPVVWVQRLWGEKTAERVYGPDVMLAVCERTAGTGIRHVFWGGMPGVADQLADIMRARFPGLEIVGTYTPEVGAVPSTPDPAVIAKLAEWKPDIVWIGLGSPKQDLWMALYQPVLPGCVAIGVGAAFDFLSGVKRQAPRWMRQSGLEWVFRLMQEPRRLARRYLVYNPRFVLGIIQQHLSR